MRKIFAIGDVHGCYHSLRALLEEQICPSQEDKIILLGDMINRGPDSKLVLDYLITLTESGYQLTCLQGNHEFKFMMAYQQGWEFFFDFLDTYNSTDLLVNDVEKYLAFISGMDIFVEEENFILSHIGFNERVKTPSTDTRSLFSDVDIHIELTGKRQITGHFPRTLAQIQSDIASQQAHISIDGGCASSNQRELGYLCGLELGNQQLFYQKNRENKTFYQPKSR